MQKTCRQEDCSTEVYAKGLCHNHYRQSKRAAAMAARPAKDRRRCDVEGCVAFHYGGGLCRSHYYKSRRAAAAAERPAYVMPTCSTEGCDHVANGGYGMCPSHYHRRYRRPDLTMTGDQLRERYPSTTWDTKTWELALTVRGDVLDHILDDMFRFSR